MRKFISVILLLVYAFISSSATLHLHQCQGQTVLLNVYDNKDMDQCPLCNNNPLEEKKNKNSNSCCEDSDKDLDIAQCLDIELDPAEHTDGHFISSISPKLGFEAPKVLYFIWRIVYTFYTSAYEKPLFTTLDLKQNTSVIGYYISHCKLRL